MRGPAASVPATTGPMKRAGHISHGSVIVRSSLYHLLMISALLMAGAVGAEPAGRFVWVRGEVSVAAPQGPARIAVTGDPVNEGDTIRTGADGLAQIRFVDRGILSVRPDTELELRRYSAGEDPRATGSILMNLARGGVRSVTGLIGKLNPSGYMLETPTAILGVRGTDHETHYVPPAPPGTMLAMAPGTYDRVYEGATVLRTATQEIELRAGQTGFVGHGAFAPQAWSASTPIDRSPADVLGQPGRAPTSAPAAIGGPAPPPPTAARAPSQPGPIRAPLPEATFVPRPEPPRSIVAPEPDPRPDKAPRSSTRPVWEVLAPPAVDPM